MAKCMDLGLSIGRTVKYTKANFSMETSMAKELSHMKMDRKHEEDGSTDRISKLKRFSGIENQ